uniref:CRISPR-associated protein Csm3 n=1 Tax=Lactococcus lactis subsp. lactis TaxID=1360 RepID=UPI001E67DF91|nr:Chain F, CRISPR-associated protein Csm3 [Lactococcus lactis subsp. lactis]6XN3_G Chain G, CRISPR-associated protein Csm3 [Lactococcus lactis subsp. lactis]6XN3_H Chain H, CRISPR-associated protein Csm3 [Lactococcus lactis subsp. lactis]6XN3_I Chain I, CRISPR-associated protein Csm3 [Lactococcus lactis subsp. lactis]6XN4_F Chain F, CRISPR-associated protein Csm3 [Lactococcus lactis subsp. lactis]6XN4_G Chain G, CRISPR-associated protein Csm3 [Lactococcus lactis subsp. lactis]6XN4_H Chain H,
MKLVIEGTIVLKTGMHIGGSSDFSAIGAVASPVVRDTLTRLPLIPGSSLKGKMRYLLAKELNNGILLNEPNNDQDEILRLFGSSEKDKIRRARLKFNDIKLSNLAELETFNVSSTEVKFENTINRKTAVANPRQIERVIAGSKFDFEIFYNLDDIKEVEKDFENIKQGFDLLEFDYLGGHGTRGSGRIAFENLSVITAVGNFEKINTLNEILGA